MVRSMTGYGRAKMSLGGRAITTEIRSVNHRFFDFSARVPRIYGFLEDALRKLAQQTISRGKADVFVLVENEETADVAISLNRPVVDAYMDIIKILSDEYPLKPDVGVYEMMNHSDALSTNRVEADTERITCDVTAVMSEALAQFEKMRAAEGENLKIDLQNRTVAIENAVEQIETRSPGCVLEYKAKLEARIKELCQGFEPDEARIVTEAAIYADRIAVDEETVRLRSHISQLRQTLETSSPIGKKLDFLVQEMHREANTIGSKAQDTDVTRLVLDIKSEIEKMREQVANIE